MKKGMICLSLLMAVQMIAPGAARSITVHTIDPHEEPARCKSCHNSEIQPGEKVSAVDTLLGEGIDDTCHICHPYDCCMVNSLKGHNHPSNVSKWDVDNFTPPEKLPLFDGLITCLTCHYHRKSDIIGRGYKMVRLAEVGPDRIDWTALCLDCHVGY